MDITVKKFENLKKKIKKDFLWTQPSEAYKYDMK